MVYKVSIPKLLLLMFNTMSIQQLPVQYPCVICKKGVKNEENAMECEKCMEWTHISCDGNISVARYNMNVAGEIDINYLCRECISKNSMKNSKDLGVIDLPEAYLEEPIPPYQQQHSKTTNEYKILEKSSNKGADILQESDGHLFVKKINKRSVTVNWSFYNKHELIINE